mgnify:CR=1 FL=1
MCTLTINSASDRLLVTMSRDERRDRAPESPPRQHLSSPSMNRWAGPIDGEAGGTWIGTNAYGLTACLLNTYENEDPLPGSDEKAPLPSRGRIIPMVLGHADVESAVRWMTKVFDPSQYRGFILVLAEPGRVARVAWLGGKIVCSQDTRPWVMESSSSWNQDSVLPWRDRAFALWMANGSQFAGDLPAFHTYREPDMAEWSPLMERDYSATRSISEVAINEATGLSTMRYRPVTPGKPLQREPPHTLSLDLAPRELFTTAPPV